jgi:hypothetical protein
VFDQTPVTGELEKAVNPVLAGRDSAPHTIRGTVLMRRDGALTMIRIAEPAVVEHAGRHLPITLEPGDYVISPLRERGDGLDRSVED